MRCNLCKSLSFRFAIIILIAITSPLLAYLYLARNTISDKPKPSISPAQKQLNKAIPPKNGDLIFTDDLEFLDNFFFGTASSDFQTTGGNGLTDWEPYIQECVKSQRCPPDSEIKYIGPEVGTDYLNRYREDFDLANQIGPLIHRLSLEWARIEPEEGKFDKDAIKKYKEIFRYMKIKGIEPMICLNHFALPIWISNMGGLESPQFSHYYARYAEVVAKEVGLPLKIRWWLTFNEPQITLQGYVRGNEEGSWPPHKGIKSLDDEEGYKRLLLSSSHLIDAHRLSYRAIHKILGNNNVMVGFASAPGSFYPFDQNSTLDKFAYNIHNTINSLSLDYLIGTTDRDFIGLNYYGRIKLKFHISMGSQILSWLTENQPFAIEWEMPDKRIQGNRSKEFYPQGLYDMIIKFKDLDLPIVITENGLDDADDKFREEFIILHLKAVFDAIKDGANVIGYQYWSLTDTWEWDGMFSNMGLIAIDRENNLTRSLRPSALTYGEIIRTHRISKELLEKHKELLLKK